MSKYRFTIEVRKNDGYRWTITDVHLIAENPKEAVNRAVELAKDPGQYYLTVIPKIISCEELGSEE